MRTRRWCSVFFLEATLRLSRPLSEPSSGSETSLWWSLCTTHHGSQVPVRSLFVDRNGIQPRVRQQAVTFVSAVCLMNRRIVIEATGWRDTRTALKTWRNSQVRQEDVTVFTCCNKEHQCQCTRVLYTSADLTDL